tara:strand:- start:2915 stop:3094 length:180 start_codon:yes stop_codon:yes gene_type:complete
MKFKIVAEVTIDEDSSLMPVTCNKEEKAREGENVIKDVVKDLLYDMDDIEVKSIKVTKT